MVAHETRTPHRPPIAAIVLACSLSLHATCVPLFALVAQPHRRYAEPAAVFYLFLGASAAVAVAMSLVWRAVYFRGLLLARVVLLLLLNAPFGGYLTIRLLLLLALLPEIAISEPFPANLVSALLVLVANIVAVGVGMSGSLGQAEPVHDLTAFAITGIVVSVTACAMASYRERMALYGREMEKMGSAAEELMRAQMGYLEYARSAEQRSTQSERNRLSAELHDSLGYTFTNLKMMLEAAKDLMAVDRQRLRDLLETALEQVQQGMTETRKALYLVRERHEAPPPFLNSVHRMIQVFKKATGVDVAVDYANFPADCGASVELALYHFVQEGLVNSFSHGRASEIRVVLWSDQEWLRVTIEDNGLGSGSIAEGIGIRGMRERLGGLGGTLRMKSTQGGFQITAEVPIREETWNA